MSWDRTCCMSTTPSSIGSGSSSTFSPSSLTRDYDIPPPPPSSSFFVFSTSDYVDAQSTREREENSSLPPQSSSSSLYNNYYPQHYSPIFASRANVSDAACSCNSTNTTVASYDISSSFQTPFLYEQYLTSLKSEHSDHLPYLFDNIIYPQPCSPPSPTNDSITYYQLDQANGTTTTTTTTTIINKVPHRPHTQTTQPIIYHQLSLIEPPSSNIQQKLPIVKRFYYDSNMANTTTTTTIMTAASVVTNTSDNDHINLPYARLDSISFGTYDIWQERTIVGRKNNRREVDVHMGTTSVVSRVHFELLLVNNNEFQLKCLSKNGIFINNDYIKMSSTIVLPKQCTLRFPSTDLSISFSSLLDNHNSINRSSSASNSRDVSTDTYQRRLSSSSSMDVTPPISLQSVPNIRQQQQQQVILVADNQQIEVMIKHENLPPLNVNILNASSSNGSSLSADSNMEQGKCQEHESLTTNNHSFLGSSCPVSPKSEINENQPIMNSPILQRILLTGDEHPQQEHSNSKNGIKPPFSYAQLIVQAILSASDKQMTLSQIYNFISAQYPYYESNSRGWQNSIRHNLSLNRYFIRLARKENDSGKGSFWRLDQTCEEKLIDHAFRHRKQRANSTHIFHCSNIKSEDIHSPMIQYCNEQTEFLLGDIHTSNSSTPLSPMTSPLNGIHSSHQQTNDKKRKREDLINYEIEELLSLLLDSIENDTTIKRQKR